MKNFICYKHPNGEFAFIKRSEISSFKPVFVRHNQYRIVATVGKETLPVGEADSIASAEKWILDEIAIIDGAVNDGKPTSK